MFQGGAVACTSFATVLASLEASSNSDPQIVEGVRQKYEQCLKDGGIDPSSQVSSRKLHAWFCSYGFDSVTLLPPTPFNYR